MPTALYKDRTTGDQTSLTYTSSVASVRPDQDGGGQETHISVSGASVVRTRNAESITDNALDGRRTLSPKESVRTRLSADYTALSASLEVESTAGFAQDLPIAVTPEIGATVTHGIPSAVADADTLTMPTSGGAAIGVSLKKGALVLQRAAPGLADFSSRAIDGSDGVIATQERPLKPTVVATDGGATDIDTTTTLVGGGTAYAEQYVDVYVFAVGTNVVLGEHVLPSAADNAVSGATVAVNGIATFWNETTNTLDSLVADTEYYVQAVVKDAAGFAGAHESELSAADAVTPTAP